MFDSNSESLDLTRYFHDERKLKDNSMSQTPNLALLGFRCFLDRDLRQRCFTLKQT